jgi:hypothetical protein
MEQKNTHQRVNKPKQLPSIEEEDQNSVLAKSNDAVLICTMCDFFHMPALVKKHEFHANAW